MPLTASAAATAPRSIPLGIGPHNLGRGQILLRQSPCPFARNDVRPAPPAAAESTPDGIVAIMLSINSTALFHIAKVAAPAHTASTCMADKTTPFTDSQRRIICWILTMYPYYGKKYPIYVYSRDTFHALAEKSIFAANDRKAIWK